MPRGKVPEAGEARAEVCCVRMTKAEKDAMDQARGKTPRSTFIREAVRNASKASG